MAATSFFVPWYIFVCLFASSTVFAVAVLIQERRARSALLVQTQSGKRKTTKLYRPSTKELDNKDHGDRVDCETGSEREYCSGQMRGQIDAKIGSVPFGFHSASI